jgi:hypothetical protein
MFGTRILRTTVIWLAWVRFYWLNIDWPQYFLAHRKIARIARADGQGCKSIGTSKITLAYLTLPLDVLNLVANGVGPVVGAISLRLLPQ